MNRILAASFAAIACATTFCAAPVSAQPFATGKDGVHPRIERALSAWDAADVPATARYEGIWQNAPTGSESGWAIAFAARGDAIVATWFTYDDDGSPIWLALHAEDVSTLVDGFAAHTAFVGEFERAYATPASDVAVVTYGPAAVEFQSPTTATLYYNVSGDWRHKTIERTFAADAIASCSPRPPFDGLWTAAPLVADDDYRGGLHVARAGDNIVATWFTFDARGNAVWRVITAAPADGLAYAGTIYEARGPALTMPFDATSVSVRAVGQASLAFGDGQGMFRFDVSGTPSAVAIVHSTGAAPVSHCF